MFASKGVGVTSNVVAAVGRTYSNLEIDKLVRDCAHLVVEAKRVVADLVARENKVALALFLPLCYNLARRGGDLKVDIERASGLHLQDIS